MPDIKAPVFLALCAIGGEPIVAQELKHLNFVPGERLPGRVFFSDSEHVPPVLSMFRANFLSRAIDRVYLELDRFAANDFDDLFEGIRALPWETYIYKNSKIVIDKVRIFKSDLSSEHAVQSVAHKALRERLCKAFNVQQLSETGHVFSVRIYIERNHVHVLLDLSGEPLHRRGYRLYGGEAPLRETVGALLIYAMHWKRKYPLYDPFCGAGTIPIEAALYAHNIPAGIGRAFAFEQFKLFNTDKTKDLLTRERIKGAERIQTECRVRIVGSDIDAAAAARAKKNAERSFMTAGRALQEIGSDKRIPRPEFLVADARSVTAPFEEGFVLSNLPYGKRIGSDEQAHRLYKSLHDFSDQFKNWDLGFITDHETFAADIDLPAEKFKLKKRCLKSGNLDTVFFWYKIK